MEVLVSLAECQLSSLAFNKYACIIHVIAPGPAVGWRESVIIKQESQLRSPFPPPATVQHFVSFSNRSPKINALFQPLGTGPNCSVCFFASKGFNNERTCDKEFIIRRTATNRVLNVLRHWVSKHAQVIPTFQQLINFNDFIFQLPLQVITQVSHLLMHWGEKPWDSEAKEGRCPGHIQRKTATCMADITVTSIDSLTGAPLFPHIQDSTTETTPEHLEHLSQGPLRPWSSARGAPSLVAATAFIGKHCSDSQRPKIRFYLIREGFSPLHRMSYLAFFYGSVPSTLFLS